VLGLGARGNRIAEVTEPEAVGDFGHALSAAAVTRPSW